MGGLNLAHDVVAEARVATSNHDWLHAFDERGPCDLARPVQQPAGATIDPRRRRRSDDVREQATVSGQQPQQDRDGLVLAGVTLIAKEALRWAEVARGSDHPIQVHQALGHARAAEQRRKSAQHRQFGRGERTSLRHG